MTFYKYIQRREHGLKPRLGDEDFLYKCIYNAFQPYKTWNDCKDEVVSEYGGVFNLEFSPEGNLLVAACEKKSIVLFDPITTKHTKTITNAHLDNVNCVKFLDSRMFATCSDDTTVALWDTRNLKQKIRSLQGHSNWVKNIEYSQKDGLLVTSGFDGSIYTWDINSYTEQGFIYQKVFHTSGLMRCRISPDATKLVICTTGGYLIIIHDLDLTTLAKDLCGFRPNIYRLMQLGRQYIPQAAKFDHVFSKNQKRNRVELVSDFPDRNDAEVVCALQIHPQGWCALSRNISYDEGSEWTCIHDIQEFDEDIYNSDEPPIEAGKKRKYSESDETSLQPQPRTNNSSYSSSNFESTSRAINDVAATAGGGGGRLQTNTNRSDSFVPDIWAAEVTVQDRACRAHRSGSRNTTTSNAYAYVYAISSGVIAPLNNLAPRGIRNGGGPNRYLNQPTNNPTPPPPSILNNTNNQMAHDEEDLVRDSRSIYKSFYNRQIYQNVTRLLYYIEEPNKGKGFIKEPSFSSDGRIICSPYGNGVRLLAFSQDCSELPGALNSSKQQSHVLQDVKHTICHSDIVVSTKFSPRHPLLVTGCLRGRVVWHQPVF